MEAGEIVVMVNKPVALPYTVYPNDAEHAWNELAFNVTLEKYEGMATSVPIVAKKLEVCPPGDGFNTLDTFNTNVLM